MNTISLMDYIGTFAFALSGAYLAIQYKLDIFGVCVCAWVTAVGGGITRDVVMNVGVPRFFSSYTTMYIIAIAIVIAVITKSDRWKKLMLTADAIGLAVFAIDTGVKGINNGYNFPQVVFVSVITAVGGGVIRDLLLQRVPMVLRKEIYASAALAGAVVLYTIHPFVEETIAIYISLLVVFGVRMWSVVKHIDLPVVKLDAPHEVGGECT